MAQDTYDLSLANFGEDTKKIEDQLRSLKVKEKEIYVAMLLVEEIFTYLLTNSHPAEGMDAKGTVTIKDSWVETSLQLVMEGDECSPIIPPSENLMLEYADYTEDKANRKLLMFYGSRDNLSYLRKGKRNIVTIKVQSLDSSRRNLYRTMFSMFLGGLAGSLLFAFADPASVKTLMDEAVSPLQSLLLNAFNIFVAPVILFSLWTGMNDMSGVANLGKTGARLMVISIVMLGIATIASIGLGLAFFPEDLSHMRASIAGADAPTVSGYSIKDVILGIVPDNVVDPLRGKNILQVMFLALLLGLALRKTNSPMPVLSSAIGELKNLFMAAIELVVSLVPIIIFLAMLSLTARTDILSLLPLLKVIAGSLIGIPLVLLISMLFVFLVGRISPLPFGKKVSAFVPVPIAINSSGASIPAVLEFCTDKLGISSKITSFLVPVSMQFTKTGFCVSLALYTAMMLQVFSIELDWSAMISFFSVVMLMALAKPPVAASGIVCLNYTFNVMGIPNEAVAIVFGLESLVGMIAGGSNAVSNIAVTFCVAGLEGMVDKDRYAK